MFFVSALRCRPKNIKTNENNIQWRHLKKKCYCLPLLFLGHVPRIELDTGTKYCTGIISVFYVSTSIKVITVPVFSKHLDSCEIVLVT